MNLSLPRWTRKYCTCAVLTGALTVTGWLAPAPAAAEPSYITNFRSFTDVNDNGALDCGEPVQIVTAVLTNGDSPPLSGTIRMPSTFLGSGLFFQPGTVQVDFFPLPTIGCQGQVVRGNAPDDPFGEVTFQCPRDVVGDQQDYTLILSYEAIYHNSVTSSFTPTAQFELDDGTVIERSNLQTFPTASCPGVPNDVAVTKTAAGTGEPGTVLLYTITVHNPSTLAAGGVTISDAVPASTVFEPGASSPGWFCPAPGPGNLCRTFIGTVPAGGSVTRHFAVRIDAPLPSTVASISNTACAREGPDLILGCGSVSTPTAGQPLLSLSKALQSGTGTPGTTLVYRLTVANTGNQGAGLVTLAETIPANTTFAPGQSSPGWSCTPSPAAGSTCRLLLPDLAAGSSATADFAVTIAPALPAGVTQVANTACASTSGGTEDCATQTTPTNASPNVNLTKTVTGTATPGSVLVYTLALHNTGNQAAGNVSLREVVPDHTTFEPAQSAAGWTCSPSPAAGSTCSLSIGTLAAGANLTFAFAARIAPTLPAGVRTLGNTACAHEGNTQLDCDSMETPTDGSPDVQMSKSLLSGTGAPGTALVYRLTLTNTGNQGSGPVALTETIPLHTAFLAAQSSTGWTCTPGQTAGSTCTLTVPGLAAGATSAVDFAVSIASTLPAGTTSIANTACAEIAGQEPDCSTQTTPTTGNPSLNLSKGVSGFSSPGSLLTYTLSLQNTGNQDAAGVTLEETVPAHTVFEPGESSPGWACSPSPAAGSSCTLAAGTIAAGATLTFEFAVRVVSPLPAGASTIDNTSCATGSGLPESCDTVTTPALGAPDIRLEKTYSGPPATPGALLVFALTVRNLGNQNAGPLRLTETVPPLATFDAAASGAWTCVPDVNPGATCTHDLPGLAAGDSRSIDFALRAAADLPANATIANAACARILPDGLEGCGSTETPPALSLATTLTVALANDADASGSITAGDTLRYTLTLPNITSSALLSLVAVPTLDPNTTLVVGSVMTDRGTVSSGNTAGDAIAEISIPTLPAGDVATVTFDVRIAKPLPTDIRRISAQAFTRGANVPEDASDDPTTPAADDPTAVDVAAPGDPRIHDIPTIGQYGLMALALLLAAGAVVHLRRQGAVQVSR